MTIKSWAWDKRNNSCVTWQLDVRWKLGKKFCDSIKSGLKPEENQKKTRDVMLPCSSNEKFVDLTEQISSINEFSMHLDFASAVHRVSLTSWTGKNGTKRFSMGSTNFHFWLPYSNIVFMHWNLTIFCWFWSQTFHRSLYFWRFDW